MKKLILYSLLLTLAFFPLSAENQADFDITETEEIPETNSFADDDSAQLDNQQSENQTEDKKTETPDSSDTSEPELTAEENLTESDSADTETEKTETQDESEENKPVRKSLGIVPEEILDRPEIEKFRKQYLSEKWSKLLYAYLESAMEYRLYVRKAIMEKDMPEVLEYLPVVESNYKTNAKSRSGAIGMWQFMSNSVWPFLTLNDFVDERLDPWKSTDAALRKLTDNYNYFNDWLIAIASYNCGVGAMNKVLKKSQEKDFWYLVDHKLLPQQTADYVPKLLAIADLAINSEYYGINLPDHKEEFEVLENEKNGNFDYITVTKAYSISQLAQEMRMDTNTLKRLNPSYVRGMTHPAKESKIRLPLGMEQSGLDAIEKLTPIEFPFKYTVVAGDSLWSISRRYGVTVSSICELNDIKENAILKIGKVLYIPAK